MTFELKSSFANEGYIPREYTCDGNNVSPPLRWHTAPDTTKSFALIIEDPDVQPATWTHWVLYNIPAEADHLPSGFPSDPALSDGIRSGLNSWGWTGYNGPCPSDGIHRYFFKLYALDIVPDLPAGASKEQLMTSISGHILAEAGLMGFYGISTNNV